MMAIWSRFGITERCGSGSADARCRRHARFIRSSSIRTRCCSAGEPVTEFDDELRKLVEECSSPCTRRRASAWRAADRDLQAAHGDRSSIKKNPKDKIVLINPEIIEPKASSLRKRAA